MENQSKPPPPRNNEKKTIEIIINGVNIKEIKEFVSGDTLNQKTSQKNAKNEKSVSLIKDLHQVAKDSKNFKNIKDLKHSKDIKDSKECRKIKEPKIIKKVEEKEKINITTVDNQNKSSLSNVSTNEIWAMLHEGRSMDSDDFDYPLSYEVDYNAKLPPEIEELGQ